MYRMASADRMGGVWRLGRPGKGGTRTPGLPDRRPPGGRIQGRRRLYRLARMTIRIATSAGPKPSITEVQIGSILLCLPCRPGRATHTRAFALRVNIQGRDRESMPSRHAIRPRQESVPCFPCPAECAIPDHAWQPNRRCVRRSHRHIAFCGPSVHWLGAPAWLSPPIFLLKNAVKRSPLHTPVHIKIVCRIE